MTMSMTTFIVICPYADKHARAPFIKYKGGVSTARASRLLNMNIPIRDSAVIYLSKRCETRLSCSAPYMYIRIDIFIYIELDARASPAQVIHCIALRGPRGVIRRSSSLLRKCKIN